MAVANGTTKLQSRAAPEQRAARQTLLELFGRCPIPREQLLVNLGLYTRSSVLAKMLYVNELYQQIVRVPGVVMEFGVWWGTNLALFESLRAIYEPYNHTRKVIGFDTFTGYPGVGAKDGCSDLARSGAYGTAQDYDSYLTEVLDYHQQENVMGHVKKYEIVKGEDILLDMQLYEPTKRCLEAIRPYLTRGSVVALDELNCDEFPGETLALKEAWGLDRYRLTRSQFLPDRTYLTIE